MHRYETYFSEVYFSVNFGPLTQANLYFTGRVSCFVILPCATLSRTYKKKLSLLRNSSWQFRRNICALGLKFRFFVERVRGMPEKDDSTKKSLNANILITLS